MKKFLFFIGILLSQLAIAQAVEQWERYEVELQGPATGNPFADVWLKAEFVSGDNRLDVQGFYDGAGKYKIRFMPGTQGPWTYTTRSNIKALNNKKGSFTCVAPSTSNHGPVKVWNTYDFAYADGKTFYPFGTTSYAWIHQDNNLQERTLRTLAASPFNKLRMCVFPKVYSYVEEEPELYAYEDSSKNASDKKHHWNFKKFNPAFFSHLEKRIDDLKKLGIECDLILFHPYDKGKWGFDDMGEENDLLYLKYITARLSSFRNVWWSMANEYDFMKNKPRQAWDKYSRAVVANDPFHHLISIHNGSIYYENYQPYFTHVSVQNGSAVEEFGRANLLRDAYFKPVIYDEVCYEGNLAQRWGRLSGEEMTDAFWQGMIAGTYVTHGETFHNKGDTIFWAEGGELVGSSPARIAFLRQVWEQGPGPLHLADEWKDYQTTQFDSSYYIVYFGKQTQAEWIFNLPKKGAPLPGATFKAELIDTWNMTITPLEGTFELGKEKDYRYFDTQLRKIRMPVRPYLALRLRRV